jgi:fatty-acyl-CoA synthase
MAWIMLILTISVVGWGFRNSLAMGIIRAVFELLMMLLQVKLHGFLHGGKIWSIADRIEHQVDEFPNVAQFITVESGAITTAAEMDALANQFANWGRNEINLQQKNTVCLMLLNSPQYVSFWVGMTKIGVSTALLNTNITGKPFVHSVQVAVQNSDVKVLVVDDELVGALDSDIQLLRSANVKVILWSEILIRANAHSLQRPDRSLRNQVKENDPIIFIFTSGTTGLFLRISACINMKKVSVS